MKELLGQFVFINDSLINNPEFSFEFLSRGVNVYEVFRQQNEKAIFFEEHIQRLETSAKSKGLEFTFDIKKLEANVKELCHANKQSFGNIKIVLHSEQNQTQDLYIYAVPFIYPTEEEYDHGVKMISLNATRPDPNIKNWRPDFKKKIKRLKEEFSVYEIILINEHDIVTEGSQSNLFFIKNNRIFTARKEKILPGITRDYIIRICIENKISLTEIDFDKDLLYEADAVFISGTSPKILPVSKIDGFSFSSKHKFLKILMDSYNELINNYIKSNK